MRIAVLGSTRGSTFEKLNTLIENADVSSPHSHVSSPRRRGSSSNIKLVLSNNPNAGILQKAQSFGIPTESLTPIKGESRDAYDKRVSKVLEDNEIAVVLMIGYMRIVSKWFTEKWHRRVINVHPSLLPKHKGLMDLAVHQAVIDAGETETGCSVHFVTEEVDGGEVVVQEKCAVTATDTAETVKAKVQALEAPALLKAIEALTF